MGRGWARAWAACAVFFLSLLSHAQSAATDLSACLPGLEAEIFAQSQNQLHWYEAYGGSTPSPEKRSRFLMGTNGQAVLVVHGFMASPLEMNEISEQLNAEGFTVYTPLITGFGASPEAANRARIEDWQTSYKTAVETLGLCFSKISVVGYSLGGALTLNDLLNSAPTQQTMTFRPSIAKLALLAPYLRTQLPGLNILNDLIKKYTATVDLRVMRFLYLIGTGGEPPFPFPPIGNSEEDTLVPLQAIESALDLQKNFVLTHAATDAAGAGAVVKKDIPVFLALAADDYVIDSLFARSYVEANFQSTTLFVLPMHSGASHFLNSAAFNPSFAAMMQKMIEHLKRD